MGAQSSLRQVRNTPEICDVYHKNNFRHADTQMENVGGLVYNSDINKRKEKMLNTDNWAQYPFSVNGVNFVSKIDTNGSFYPQISRMPTAMVDLMNTQAITDLVGDPSLMTTAELQAELETINAGASQALLCLA